MFTGGKSPYFPIAKRNQVIEFCGINSQTVYDCRRYLNEMVNRYDLCVIRDIPSNCRADQIDRMDTIMEISDEQLQVYNCQCNREPSQQRVGCFGQVQNSLKKSGQGWIGGAQRLCLNHKLAGSALLLRLLRDIVRIVVFGTLRMISAEAVAKDETILHLHCTWSAEKEAAGCLPLGGSR